LLVVAHAIDAMTSVLGIGELDTAFLAGLSQCRNRVLPLESGYLLAVRGIRGYR